MKNKYISLLAAGSLLVSASSAFALNFNITVADNRNSPGTYNSFTGSGGGGLGSNTAGVGFGQEDQETEPGTISNQLWDMEAFVVDNEALKLYIVGGYNMQNGEAGSGGVVSGRLLPGDLFIKVGGTQPLPNPTTNTPATVVNSTYGNNGYTYAIDLSLPLPGTGTFGSTTNRYNLNANSVLDTVIYDSFGANPWKFNSGATSTSTVGISYTTGLLNGAAQLNALNLGGLLGAAVGSGRVHNIMEVDLSFLAGVQDDVYFSYTMECGNDSLKGLYSGGFDSVPDGATSILLIALGLVSMVVFGSKRRKA